MKLKIAPYKLFSKSAKALSKALGVKRLIPGSSYRPGYRTTVINWGSSSCNYPGATIINRPEAVKVAANKLLTFQALKRAGVPVPEFTTDRHAALEWQRQGLRIVARQKLNAHTGEGLIIVQTNDALPHAPLYVKYVRKEKEYRVHVFRGQIIDLTEKRKRHGAETINPYVRNLSSGWVFCRTGLYPSEQVKTQSIRAVQALGLDFGAVDIIERNGQVWVLEVNSAPGLEATTLTKYTEAFRRISRGF